MRQGGRKKVCSDGRQTASTKAGRGKSILAYHNDRGERRAVPYTTQQKLALTRVLQRAERPLTPAEISGPEKAIPRLGIATVYRRSSSWSRKGGCGSWKYRDLPALRVNGAATPPFLLLPALPAPVQSGGLRPWRRRAGSRRVRSRRARDRAVRPVRGLRRESALRHRVMRAQLQFMSAALLLALLARIFQSFGHPYDPFPASGSYDGDSQGICGLPAARMCQPERQDQSMVHNIQACMRVEYETSGLGAARSLPPRSGL